MKLVFCGTPQFAVPTLESLIAAGHNVSLVVSQPDRPQGRGLALAPSPVKQCAERHKLRLEQPEKIKNNSEFRALLEDLAADAIIVVGYGRIIPPWMLSLPKYGNINLHGSLLPKYRGAAPIQWAIACCYMDAVRILLKQEFDINYGVVSELVGALSYYSAGLVNSCSLLYAEGFSPTTLLE